MTLDNGSTVERDGEMTGKNGVAHLGVGVASVTKLQVYFPTEGAIAQLNYNFCATVMT